jgi:polyhydroxyalkanoate synthesis regulator phasin
MSFIDDMSDTARKIFLVGVGAVAVTAEKSGQIVDDLVKKGEITVEQGKTLNEELKHKAATASNDTEATILRARMRNMSAEEREAYVAKIAQIKDDLNAEPVEVEGEPVEDVEETSSDEVAEEPTADDTEA